MYPKCLAAVTGTAKFLAEFQVLRNTWLSFRYSEIPVRVSGTVKYLVDAQVPDIPG
jgi:hypothetical protein